MNTAYAGHSHALRISACKLQCTLIVSSCAAVSIIFYYYYKYVFYHCKIFMINCTCSVTIVVN